MSAFVPKPIYFLMGLMSMIGSQEMDLTSSSGIDGAMGTLFQNLSKVLELNYLEINFIFSDTLASYEKDDLVSILLSNRCKKMLHSVFWMFSLSFFGVPFKTFL